MEPIVTHKQERELDARIAEKVMSDMVVWVDNKIGRASCRERV